MEVIEWENKGDHLAAHVGTSTYRYYPGEMRMHWRGKDYYGVAREDIDAFVHNRSPEEE